MLKKNNSENISKFNLPMKQKSLGNLSISKLKKDLRINTANYIKHKCKKMKTPINFCINRYKYCSKKNLFFPFNYFVLGERRDSKTEKSINKFNLTEEFNIRKKILNISSLSNKNLKINQKILSKSCKILKSFSMAKTTKKIAILKIKNNNDGKTENYHDFQRKIINIRNIKKSTEKKIYKEKSQKNLRARNYIHYNINDIYNKKSHSFDNLNTNIIDIKKNKSKKQKCLYIKVNKIVNNKNEISALHNYKIKVENNKSNNENDNPFLIGSPKINENKKKLGTKKNNNNKKSSKLNQQDYNIFLDKEFQEKFIQKGKVIKVNNFYSNKKRKYNSLLIKKNNSNNNNLTSTISSISTNNSSHCNNRDWVYRLYNEEMNKKRLEKKIITTIRKSILEKISSAKTKKEKNIYENSKYDRYGNYKNIHIENNFINNLLLLDKKNLKIKKRKKNLCLNKEIQNNKKLQEQKNLKTRYNIKKRKTNFYFYNDELINEEDEEKEIDREDLKL